MVHRGRTLGVAAAVVVGLVGLIVLFGYLGDHSVVKQSDDATAVLKGRAMAHGNLLLSGWRSTSDSFLTIDQPFYAVASWISGLRPGLMTVVPAILAGLVVLVGARMVSGVSDRAGTVAGVVTVVGFLAFPTYSMAQSFLEGQVHDGTALWSLLGFWMLRRNRVDWWYGAAVLLLGTGMVGDLQLAAYAVVPIALGGVVAALRCRNLRAGAVPVSAAIAAVVIYGATREIFNAVGSFAMKANNPLAPRGQVVANVHLLASYLGQLVGVANGSFGTGGVPRALQAVHVVGAAVLVACLVAAAIGLVRGVVTGGQRHDPSEGAPWRVDDMLTFAVFGPAVAFLFLTLSAGDTYSRYLTATVIFAAVLGGRVIARHWGRLSPGRNGWRRVGTSTAGVMVVASFAAGVGFQIDQAPPVQPAASLATWLEAHHLIRGVGDYWSSSITTVESSGRVQVRPVATNQGGRLIAFNTGPSRSWFGPTRFSFVVFTPGALGNVDTTSAVDTFGTPSHTYAVGDYTVLTWSKPFTVSIR